ncbi:MAG: squalene synthase HpnC [Pseudomonadota bacterium]
MTDQTATDQTATDAIETPTGKGAGDENFPVASWLVARHLRGHVARFYAFARAADDIADNPDLAPKDKIRRLDAFEAGLDGTGPAKAMRLAESLAQTDVPDRHARDLLAAFRQDAVKSRYASWDELIGYCELSANPVGRYLMDLHGEDRALWAPSDALCTVLQILNHLQDAQKDLAQMDRVYVPLDMLAAQGLTVDVLHETRAPDGYRRVLDQMLDLCEALLAVARTRPVPPVSRRLHAETALITRLATRLAQRLRAEDPLAGRVKLSKLDFARAALSGLRALMTPGRG